MRLQRPASRSVLPLPPKEKLELLAKDGRPVYRKGRELKASRTWAYNWLLRHGFASKRRSTKRTSTPEAPEMHSLHTRAEASTVCSERAWHSLPPQQSQENLAPLTVM